MNTYYISDVDSYTFVKKIASIILKGPKERKKCVRMEVSGFGTGSRTAFEFGNGWEKKGKCCFEKLNFGTKENRWN